MLPKIVKALEVSSSTIKKIAHTEGGDLLVTFNNGTDYLYKGVPEQTYDSMAKSESVGKFFHAEIKNKFEFVKLEKA